MVETRIYCAMCVTRKTEQEIPLARIIYCSLPFRVLLNFAHNAQDHNHSMNEKLVVLKIADFLTINYIIVLSSVLFRYGTFICITTTDIIL